MRRNTDGIGTSGLCISQLSFDVPGELYAARAAKTVVKGVSGLPTYYIDSRTKSKGVVSVTCLDRLAFADIDFPIDKCLELGSLLQRTCAVIQKSVFGMGTVHDNV